MCLLCKKIIKQLIIGLDNVFVHRVLLAKMVTLVLLDPLALVYVSCVYQYKIFIRISLHSCMFYRVNLI